MSHEDGIGKLWSEIGRRNVGRVAVVYAGAAWGIVHMSTVMAEALEIPHWVNRFLVFLLVAFAPVVIGFSWVFELTPEGFKRAAEVEQNAALSGRTARRLNIAIIVLMILLAGLYGADRFLLPHEATEGAHVATEGAKTPAAEGGITIAVLPFLDLSPNKDQDYFSDGMTEEITSALAKVKGLRVVGRTSAFEFKGQNKDLRTIGKALSASHVLEGSVRKAGSRVRITGQLINVEDGTHLWTEDYDRELTDVFATQDDIARAIAAALQVPLGLKSEETLVTGRTIDAGIHEEYLRVKASYHVRVGGENLTATPAMESLVARAPDYAPASALLAQLYASMPSSDRQSAEAVRRNVETYLPKAEAAGRHAIALDPRSADSYTGLALALQSRGEFGEAEELYKKGLAIDPYNPDLLHFYAEALQFNGRITEAVAMRRQLLALDPLVPNSDFWAAQLFFYVGQYDAAVALLKALPVQRGGRLIFLLLNDAALGHRDEAINAILESPVSQAPPDEVAAAVKLLRTPRTAVAPRDLPQFKALYPVYFFVGAPERAFDQLLKNVESVIGGGYHYPVPSAWGPLYAPARKTQRFKTLMRKAGLVDYWVAHGWPEVCHPLGADDFECP